MKGITPVIATILLLLIVIAIVGYSFGFFQKIFQSSSDASQKQVDATVKQVGQSIRIESIGNSGQDIYIRNSGGSALTTTSIRTYVNGVPKTCGWGAVTSIASEGVEKCTLALADACASGNELKVTTAGLTVSETCP